MNSILATCVALTMLGSGNAFGNDMRFPEQQLFSDLSRAYNRATRPAARGRDAVSISVILVLNSIAKLDHSSVTISAFPQLMWTDPRLSWNPSEYDGVAQLIMPAQFIWTPDFINWIEETPAEIQDAKNNGNVDIFNTGYVNWVPRVNIQTRCEDPDQIGLMNCTFKMGSWTYTSKQVDFFLVSGGSDGMDLGNYYTPSRSIELVSNTVQREEFVFPCCLNQPYTLLIYNLVLRQWDTCECGKSCDKN